MNKLLFAFVGVMLASTFPDTSAQALNQRSWVSNTGTGTACTRTNPCNDFSKAQDATNSGGTIHCVSSEDYTFSNVPFMITKSLTIDCAGTLGIHGGQNIEVNGAGIVVHLRNLLIDGGTASSTVSVGVNFINGAALYIENCTISGWGGSATGIAFSPVVTAKLIVLDSTIVDNGSGGGNIYSTNRFRSRAGLDRPNQDRR